jgi:hypothetical protein
VFGICSCESPFFVSVSQRQNWVPLVVHGAAKRWQRIGLQELERAGVESWKRAFDLHGEFGTVFLCIILRVLSTSTPSTRGHKSSMTLYEINFLIFIFITLMVHAIVKNLWTILIWRYLDFCILVSKTPFYISPVSHDISFICCLHYFENFVQYLCNQWSLVNTVILFRSCDLKYSVHGLYKNKKKRDVYNSNLKHCNTLSVIAN